MNVTSLKKQYKISIVAENKASGWVVQPQELERLAKAAAQAKRKLEGWKVFAKKPG